MGAIEIRGQRVVLRDFASGDAPSVLEYHLDPEVMRFLPPDVSQNRTLDAIVALLRETSEEAKRIPRRNYDLAVTVDGNVVGAARLHQMSADRGDGEIGYILRRDVWGNGLGTEIARLLLAYGFDVLGLEEITAVVDQSNVPSARVLQKAGMHLEGPLEPGRQLVERRNASLRYLIRREDR